MNKKLDFTGLSCPAPVIEMKKELASNCNGTFEIVVDNIPAKENVIRFLGSQGVAVEEIMERENSYTIIAVSGEKTSEQLQETTEGLSFGSTYIIDKDSIGKGDEALGRKLFVAFFKTLLDCETIPQTLFFMNKGVYFCLKDADTIESLKELHKRGVEVMVCGTCTDFFGVTEQVDVGVLSNMYDLINLYNRDRVITM